MVSASLPAPTTDPEAASLPILRQRLVARFFAGSFSSLSLISQSQFLEDFREGNHRYCSESLVNAILGKACKLFNATSQLISRVNFGDAFLGEAKRLLVAEQNSR